MFNILCCSVYENFHGYIDLFTMCVSNFLHRNQSYIIPIELCYNFETIIKNIGLNSV